jgi:RNA 3'-terminal phosphate cyclase (ATP)
MITIDGSQGEGGGQVLRTSLSLSAITGLPFRIEKIRAKRNKPGLRPQHLTAVRAVADICSASLEGDELNSTTLAFKPGSPPEGGSYRFDVTEVTSSGRSAGAVTLIFQALLWPLLFADRPSEVILRGGTFVPFSPPYHYLSDVARPAFARFGAVFETSLSSWGWISDGGGEMVAVVQPAARLESVDFRTVADPKIEGIAAVTNLPSHIPHRMARRAYNLLTKSGFAVNVQPVRDRGAGPGAGIVLWMPQGGFSSLGRKGLPADKVAEAAVAELTSFVDNGAAVDNHLADQLLVPMALAHGRSTLTTNLLTRHTLTNIALLRRWLKTQIDVRGALDHAGKVTVVGSGLSRD